MAHSARFITSFSLLTLLLIAACSPAAPAATATPTVTPTPFPTFAFVQPTLAPQVAAAATAVVATRAAATFQLDPVMVERGQGRWEALECGSCHGADGSGTDNGPSLLEYEADEADFVDFLRTGGTLGADHRFPAERLSNSGIANLYHYVRSLGADAE
ncbi:MAG TPA: c-type cytochrome [Spirillospora sp.]|nr:c-type cytochrome [Spirillospora sp.]